MVYRLISPNKLQITFSQREAAAAGIDFESDDQSNLKRLKKYLIDLLHRLQTQDEALRFAEGKRLLIEIYPEEDGATVVFTAERNETGFCEALVFSFDDCSSLLAACRSLFAEHGHRILQSELYRLSGIWLLIILPMEKGGGPAKTLLSEYGSLCLCGGIACSAVKEHGEKIISDHAVDTLAVRFG